MRLWLRLTLVALLGVSAVVLVRGGLLSSKQLAVAPAAALPLPVEQAEQNLAAVLRFPTVADDSPAAAQAFRDLLAYLEGAYPRVRQHLSWQVINGRSLLLRWRGRDERLAPALLLAHLDVVPAPDPATWRFGPFSGRITSHHIWGRGALDNKVAVIGWLSALEYWLAQGWQPQRTLYFAFGADEETGGLQGAVAMARHLRAAGLQFEFILDEGGAVTEGIVAHMTRPVALVGVAEKGYVSVELQVQGQGGHASMPPPHTAIGILSAALHRLELCPMPARLEPPVRAMFAFLAPEMAGWRRWLLANLWLSQPLVLRQMAADPANNALLRTTFAATVVRGGSAENALPGAARAVINVRLLPGDGIAQVLDYMRQCVHDPQVRLRALPGHQAPAQIADPQGPAFQRLQGVIHAVFPDAVVAPYLVVGATDARHYADLSPQVLRFIPVRMAAADLARMHGRDERISRVGLAEALQFYARLLETL